MSTSPDLTLHTRALLLRYESDNAVPDDAAHSAVAGFGETGNLATVSLQPWGTAPTPRPQEAPGWRRGFDETDRFINRLLQREAELGTALPVHLFGRVPLSLMVHLGCRLRRRRLVVYQEQQQTGAWTAAFDSAQAPSPEPFFKVEGLPTVRQGGRGHIALIVEVTRSIHDEALAYFQARHSSELLATVRMQVARGPSETALQKPDEINRAVQQFRDVLNTLHQHVDGAESVLLALSCPASFAAALGTAFNPDTHHPLALHHHDGKSYLPVYVLRAARPGARPSRSSNSAEDALQAMQVLNEVGSVHEELLQWLKEKKQRGLLEKLGGESLLRSKVENTPAYQPSEVFRYLAGLWTFEIDLLLKFKRLRERLGSEEEFRECIRLYFIHEAFHVQQGGPTSYNYRGSGRTGWVLEAVDYDADALSFHAALDFRETRQGGTVQRDGPARTLERILWNAQELSRTFEPEMPVHLMSERRLRRSLVLLFQACRLSTLLEAKNPDVYERPILEISGLKTLADPHESYDQQSVQIDQVDPRSELIIAVYYRKRLARSGSGQWVADVLKLISKWEERPRSEAQTEMKKLFERFLAQHPFLVDRA